MSETYQHYQRRAFQIERSIAYLRDDQAACASAICILCVHFGIALNDAIFASRVGRALKEDDHRNASKLLEQFCRRRGLPHEGVQQFGKLLANKWRFAYQPISIDDRDAETAAVAAQRFAAWVYRTFKELAREA